MDDDGTSSPRPAEPVDGDDVVVVQPRTTRRRGTRVLVASAAVIAVVGVVVALPWLRSNVPGAAGQGDWPGQFVRCGEPVADVVTAGAPEVVPVDVSMLDNATEVGVHEEWTAAVTASSTDPTAQGWIYGTDLTLVRDGVVVAVQDGPQVPLPQDVAQWTGDYAVAPLPQWSEVSLRLASCDQYLHADGSPEVAPGTYDLVVSQTLGLQSENGTVGGWGVAVTTVTVVADGDAAPPEPTACGAPTAGLEALASQESNPAPLSLEVLPTVVDGPYGYELVVRATNTGTTSIDATTGHPLVVITRDGVIVGGLDGLDEPALPAVLAVGGHADYDARTSAFDCTTMGEGTHASTGDGDPLPPGEYEVWAVMSFTGDGLTPTRADRVGTLVAGGPEPFTID
ncbi:hypothetical protein ASD16_12055 [Cellulomonas sp. Root485]|uniref:hypothetical protein n=1 Tax=Cellulomonas sp. Root485 TaxID=1736546 RepID=UPI000701D7ED|nr:hypothetical protein [Cellulomonas sp. Root485]KQY23282.1 hypothetical protein ASD16_12055 [Cellulomonas sp. Root485]